MCNTWWSGSGFIMIAKWRYIGLVRIVLIFHISVKDSQVPEKPGCMKLGGHVAPQG